MGINSEIYLIGLAVLFFLIIVFLFIRKVSNAGNLKVKIESIPDPFIEIEKDNNLQIVRQTQSRYLTTIETGIIFF